MTFFQWECESIHQTERSGVDLRPIKDSQTFPDHNSTTSENIFLCASVFNWGLWIILYKWDIASGETTFC